MAKRHAHQYWMQLALMAAREAGQAGDIPIGAVIVTPQDQLLAIAGNRREQDHDPTAHAEIVVLRQAGRAQQDWHLVGCRLYVTLEPCPMCAAAICQARVAQIIYGADDLKAGSCGSVLHIPASAASFHRPQIIAGICEQECQEVLQTWFQDHRRHSI